MGLIDRYILRAVLTPLVLTLCVAGMLLLLEQMLRLFDFVLAEQGPVDVVGKMLANLLPHYLGLALPLGIFLGILLAFRNLSLSSELDAMNSSGISFARLLRPIYGLIIALMIFDFVLVAWIQPYGRYQYKQLQFDVTSGAFGIRIQAGEFIDLADGVTIRLGSIDRETRRAEDIFLERLNSDGGLDTITAQRGSLSASQDLSVLSLSLNDGLYLIIDKAGETLQSSTFEKLDLTIDLPAVSVFRSRGADAQEATFTELARVVDEGRAAHPVTYDAYRAGYHWRLVQPLSFLALPLLAVGMGVTGRRRASNLKPILGLIILIAYHEILEEWAQVVVAENQASPYLAIWGVFILFSILSFYLYTIAIDRSRTARLMARMQNAPIRVLSQQNGTKTPQTSSLPEV